MIDAARRKRFAPVSRAVFIHGADIEPGEGNKFAVFEEKRSSAACGSAYPTAGSRSPAACGRAIDIAIDSFTERPSESDLAVRMIGQFVDEGVGEMQEQGKEFMCSLAMLYIFKGKARVYAIGSSAVLFFEEGEEKNVWYGEGGPAGGASHENIELPPILELDADCRFVFITGSDEETVKEAVSYFEESKGEDTEGMTEYMKDKHCSYVNLYLPRRERKGRLFGM